MGTGERFKALLSCLFNARIGEAVRGSRKPARQELNFADALKNPKATFKTPERVLVDPRLDREGKREILQSWARDERELAVAEEEGMGGGEQTMLRRVLRALETIGGAMRVGTATPTKHGGQSMSPRDTSKFGKRPRLVRELMRPLNEVLHVDHDLREALVRFRDLNTSYLPVADGNEIVGILSANAATAAQAAMPEGAPPASLENCMSKEVSFCYETDTLTTAESMFERIADRCLLVIDDREQVSGLITKELIMRGRRDSRRDRPQLTHSDIAKRVAETSVRARRAEPGRPWTYTVRPKIKT